MSRLRYWIPVFFWAGVIFAFSTLQVNKSDQFILYDFIIKKTAHVIEYAILFTLLYRAFRNTTKFSKKQAAVLSFILVLGYGISDEYHQSFTPGREPKARDVFFDIGGGILAWLLIWKYLPKAPERLKNLGKSLQIN